MYGVRLNRLAAMLVAFALGLAGCADIATMGQDAGGAGPQPPQASQPVMGYVAAIDGPNAFIEHLGAVSNAGVNQQVFQGDRFFTGGATRMRIALTSGAELDLGADTDPSLFQDVQCLFIRLFRTGELFVTGSSICVESSPNAVIQHSAVDYRVLFQPAGRPKILRVTVLEGAAQPLNVPGPIVRAGYQLDLQNGRPVGAPTPASPLELRRVRAWTAFTGRPVRPPPTVRPPPKPFQRQNPPPPPAPQVQ